MMLNGIPRCLQSISRLPSVHSFYKPLSINSRTNFISNANCSCFSSLLPNHMSAAQKPELISSKVRKMSTTAEEEIIFEEKDAKGIITLNRPRALNSLTENMVVKMADKMKEWQNSKSLVIVTGAGEKAFCAGGDVVSITHGRKGDPLINNFFRTEYILDNLIGTYKVPYVAFITGIVMGGGCGISVHGKYRVASEKSLFAMPETAIGLFPDVGGSYFLPKLKGGLGMFLGLTGHRLKGWDLVRAGIATHFCPKDKIGELKAALLSLPSNMQQEHVSTLLDTFHEPQTEFSLTPHLKDISECFTAKSLDEIFLKLKENDSEFCRKQLSVLETVSPTSLVITFEQIRRGATMSLQECFKMEYDMICRCIENNDFPEGVRARLVDKDNKPKWKPATLAEVDKEAVIKEYFTPLPEDRAWMP